MAQQPSIDELIEEIAKLREENSKLKDKSRGKEDVAMDIEKEKQKKRTLQQRIEQLEQENTELRRNETRLVAKIEDLRGIMRKNEMAKVHGTHSIREVKKEEPDDFQEDQISVRDSMEEEESQDALDVLQLQQELTVKEKQLQNAMMIAAQHQARVLFLEDLFDSKNDVKENAQKAIEKEEQKKRDMTLHQENQHSQQENAGLRRFAMPDCIFDSSSPIDDDEVPNDDVVSVMDGAVVELENSLDQTPFDNDESTQMLQPSDLLNDQMNFDGEMAEVDVPHVADMDLLDMNNAEYADGIDHSEIAGNEDSMTDGLIKSEERADETIDKHKESPVDGEIVLRTNGRPSRRVSRTVKYNESLKDSDGDEAPPVKKSKMEPVMRSRRVKTLEKKGKERTLSLKLPSKSDSSMNELKVAKLNGTELECPECEYRTRSVCAWDYHLRKTHSTNAKQAGLALRCECGMDCISYKHSRTCKIANFTVINIEDKKEFHLGKRNDSELECPECEFCTRSVKGWVSHLSKNHSLTSSQAGLALRCDCGHEGHSEYHSRRCEATNTTVIQKANEPIQTPQCILCEEYPKTPRGYIEHLDRHHKTTLKEKGIYLKCYCTFKVTARNSHLTNHNKECDGHQFTWHKKKQE